MLPQGVIIDVGASGIAMLGGRIFIDIFFLSAQGIMNNFPCGMLFPGSIGYTAASGEIMEGICKFEKRLLPVAADNGIKAVPQIGIGTQCGAVSPGDQQGVGSRRAQRCRKFESQGIIGRASAQAKAVRHEGLYGFCQKRQFLPAIWSNIPAGADYMTILQILVPQMRFCRNILMCPYHILEKNIMGFVSMEVKPRGQPSCSQIICFIKANE